MIRPAGRSIRSDAPPRGIADKWGAAGRVGPTAQVPAQVEAGLALAVDPDVAQQRRAALRPQRAGLAAVLAGGRRDALAVLTGLAGPAAAPEAADAVGGAGRAGGPVGAAAAAAAYLVAG